MKTKRFFYFILAVVLLAAINVGCTKESTSHIDKRLGKKVTIGASKATKAEYGTKITYDYNSANKSLTFKWASGDGLSVNYYDTDLGIANAENYNIVSGQGTLGAKFEIDGTSMIDPDYVDKIYVHYPKGSRNGTMSGEYEISYDISNQDGTLASLGKYDLMSGEASVADSYSYDDEMVFNIELKSDVSIIRIPAGTRVIPDYEPYEFTFYGTLSITGEAIASKVTYKGDGERVYDGNTITVRFPFVNGALVNDLYICVINRNDVTDFKRYEFTIKTMFDVTSHPDIAASDPTVYDLVYEALVTKKPTSIGETPFMNGALYNLNTLNLTKIGSASYTIKTLTFEDADYVGSDPNLIWSALIDNPQYYGPLLYASPATYYWHDENNTELFSALSDMYWSGGEAISNYGDVPSPDYTTQLSVPFAVPAGNNNSNNFAVHFGYGTFNSDGIEFADGIARIIDHMYVAPTSYLLDCIKNGNYFANALTNDGDYVKIIAIGYNSGTETGRKDLYLAKDGNFVEEWTKWSLLSLGKVDQVKFDVESSDVGPYGMNTPGYFAYDDIAVRFED